MAKGNRIKKITAVVFVVFCSCVSKEQSLPVFRYSGAVSVHPVENPPFIGLPVALEYDDGRVYISDFHGDTLLVEFDVENARVVSKSIIKGTGPGDALSPLGLFMSGDTLFLLNRRTFSLGYDIPDTSGERRITFNKLCTLPGEVSNLTAIEGKYMAAGYFDGGRYAIFNSRGEKEQEFGDYPSFLAGEKDFPASAKAMYHQVRFAASRKLRRVACVSSHVLDIVDYSTSPNVVRRIQLDSYSYTFETGNFIATSRTDNTSRGAIAVSSTDDGIYILFSPSTELKAGNSSGAVNEIWYFDWNGEPVRKFPVDRTIETLKAVNDSIFYSLSWPEYELVQLNLCETDLNSKRVSVVERINIVTKQ
ncbi:MAG: TolB-like 6-bladed beta-propeller domain-containing protein [Prevotellaceae bacterium]|jgi:hypothetical protein|nr:TolB-like 6-bladed beta-propeller domain-containing protein [Prevotellaceae bacterium]